MRRIYLFLIATILIGLGAACAQVTKVSGPDGSGSFGKYVTVLTNGNYVVTDPDFSNNGIQKVGAVYLYDGVTHNLISRLRGSSTNDRVGYGEPITLPNGNFVVISAYWNNGSAAEAGAVTWVNGETGLDGIVSEANSLVGSTNGDRVGYYGVTVLTNGNYLVTSTTWTNGAAANAGALTWGSKEIGVKGIITKNNSLVGTKFGDRIGSQITALRNGNYITKSQTWTNGTSTNAGAITFGNGETGVVGEVNAGNSLVGSKTDDAVGIGEIIILTNGNYVINSWYWANGTKLKAGAVTWGSCELGIPTGIVSSANSLVGVKTDNSFAVQALMNGNYVVRCGSWDNGTVVNAGAVTWGDGFNGTKGEVSIHNSLVGSQNEDRVGNSLVCALPNGNYLVNSGSWDRGTVVNAGAVTLCSGIGGCVGAVGIHNSLVGSKNYDVVGGSRTIALPNSNYLVISPYWDNGDVIDVGAVTWGDGNVSTGGEVSVSNSLVGSNVGDKIGENGITVLSNGNYVVRSPYWMNGSVPAAGAVTFCKNGGRVGQVNATNSLIGSSTNDLKDGVVVALPNGHYVVRNENWDNGSITDAGAVTWGDGEEGIHGIINSSNSLVGTNSGDQLGSLGITTLSNGNYVVSSPNWDNGTIIDAGAVTWGNGTGGITGEVNVANSVIGLKSGDINGYFLVNPVDNGDYFIKSSTFDNGSIIDAGAVSFGDGATGLTGTINSCNSILGNINSGGIPYFVVVHNSVHDYYLIGYYADNTYFIRNGNLLASDNTSISEVVSSSEVVFADDCARIAALRPTGSSPVSGSVTAKVYAKGTAFTASGQTYVRRHHAITPAVNENTATGRVTLYYTQTDFDDYNSNRGNNLALPESPTDNTKKANLRITQQHGTSTTGNPGSYTGWAGVGPANVVIDPSDEDIFWNSVEKRWEVSFAVTGFSGFFAHSPDNSPLPVSLLSFKGRCIENAVLLEWKTTNETNAAHFEIERSTDAKAFNPIGKVKAAGTTQVTHNYTFTDFSVTSMTSIIYYRLKLVDTDGSFGYSRMISSKIENTQTEYVFPNPVAGTDQVTIEAKSDVRSVRVVDARGRKVEVTISSTPAGKTVLNFKGIPQGMYLINYVTDEGGQTRKLVVE